MDARVTNAGIRAISSPVRSDSETTTTVQSDSEGHEWFAGPARDLLGKDAGLPLSKLLGCSESTGYRLARGERGISGWQYRSLLHRPDGQTWQRVIMDGCKAQWWLDQQRALRVLAAVEVEYQQR